MVSDSNLKEMVHDSYVLNYIMWELGFWKMRVYEPKHKWNHYKIKLYKPLFGDMKLKKSSFMTFDIKGKSHVYVSTDYRFKDVADNDIHFTNQPYDYNMIAAKSLFLGIIKESKIFKWKDIEFFTPSSKHQGLDELLVKADLEQNDFQANEEKSVLRCLERCVVQPILF